MTLHANSRRTLPVLLVAAGGFLYAPGAPAQQPTAETTLAAATEAAPRQLYVPSDAAARGKYVVVVDLDTNQLHLVHRRRIVWSAPVGTGTGLRLEEEGADGWEFSTPNGVFHVQYKEEVPVWRAPDWYFIENKLPVPPPDSPKRLFPGGLGAAAIYIGKGLAIHGTDRPELLGERVSHGCIRMSNTDAQRLFHNVAVGTEVIVVGTPQKPALLPPKPTADRDKSKGPLRSAFWESVNGLTTTELTVLLNEELRAGAPDGSTRWNELAGLLVGRAVEGDEEALRGLLLGAGRVDGMRAREYRTYLADTYSRRALRTIAGLAGLPEADRAVAARAIVEAAVDLYPGDEERTSSAWPTRRVPRTVVPDGDTAGWQALRDAEGAYREWRARRDRLRTE